MSTDAADSDPEFHLVAQYDSIDDPELTSEFLDARGLTRPYINALRRRIEARRRAAADTSAPNTSVSRAHHSRSSRRGSRSARRPQVATSRPPNRDSSRRRVRSTPPSIVIVIIFRLD